MKLSIHGRTLTLTDSIKNYTEEKVLKLEKFNDSLIEISVTLSAKKLKSGHSHTAEILAYLSGSTLKAEIREENLYFAIDKACLALEIQLKKHKEKYLRVKSQSNILKKNYNLNNFDTENSEAENKEKKIVKVYLPKKPMDVDEAILQLESLNKVFLAFININTNRVSVVYKRKDNDYGLIEE